MKPRDTVNVLIDAAEMRRLRKLAQLSQTALADKAAISRPYVCLIESGGRQRVSPAVFDRLCAALGLTGPAREFLVNQASAA